jgi:hypothetical protein
VDCRVRENMSQAAAQHRPYMLEEVAEQLRQTLIELKKTIPRTGQPYTSLTGVSTLTTAVLRRAAENLAPSPCRPPLRTTPRCPLPKPRSPPSAATATEARNQYLRWSAPWPWRPGALPAPPLSPPGPRGKTGGV